MAFKIVIQERAERDIQEAFEYINSQASHAAVRRYRALTTDILSLSEMPARCPKAPESLKLAFDIRQFIFGKRTGRYRIIFRVLDEKDEVHILAVRHGAHKPIHLADLE